MSPLRISPLQIHFLKLQAANRELQNAATHRIALGPKRKGEELNDKRTRPLTERK
jgi:hypothetical protein